MSDYNIIHLEKTEVEDFISVEAGSGKVTLTMFHGKIQTGAPGWSNQVEMNAAQALKLSEALRMKAESIGGE